MVIKIEGHTDNIGSEKANQKLSAKRAESVKTYLLGKAIPKEQVLTEGLGFSKPLVDNDTEENRAKNRRVEFTIVKE